MIGGITLGRMWRHRMRGVEAPIDCAACTYMFSRTETTAERMMREPAMPSSEAERDDDLRHAGADHRDHDDQDDEVGEALPGIDEALNEEVDLAADVAADDADEDRDERGNTGGAEADDDGQLGAVDAAREHVAARGCRCRRGTPTTGGLSRLIGLIWFIP